MKTLEEVLSDVKAIFGFCDDDLKLLEETYKEMIVEEL